MSKVLIIGGGPAGMMAGIQAAKKGNEVILLEKNEKLGKKLFITGKGRCNITNACATEDLFQQMVSNEKFLYSAFYGFTNFDVIDFFEQAGLKTKIERGNRVFPFSDKSSDVIYTLQRELMKYKVEIRLNSKVTDVIMENGKWSALILNGREKIKADKLIIATGGLSYPITGSTGDGFTFAKKMGHTITRLSPSLVPFNIKESYVKDLQGLSLKNIEAGIYADGKEIYREFGEMIFTHFGVSGPVILTGSCYAAPYLGKKKLEVILDLKPALSKEQLDARILREFDEFINKQYKNSLDRVLPRKLISVIITLSEIDPEKQVNLITKEERQHLVSVIKGMHLTVDSFREYKEAIITQGGISIKEINPSTMESKRMPNVYFVGEALDLDGVTGGFNLQIAWSTGYAAGNAMEVIKNKGDSENGL
ncbi:MAG: NAD(P)/FAD-dependent oxidoreductase [Acetivibrio sp.]